MPTSRTPMFLLNRVSYDQYEDSMRPYVANSQQLPPGGVGGYAPKSSAYIALRGMSVRMMTRWPVKNLIAGQFAKANDIDLPDYDLAAIE
jgi:hypothetical protein